MHARVTRHERKPGPVDSARKLGTRIYLSVFVEP